MRYIDFSKTLRALNDAGFKNTENMDRSDSALVQVESGTFKVLGTPVERVGRGLYRSIELLFESPLEQKSAEAQNSMNLLRFEATTSAARSYRGYLPVACEEISTETDVASFLMEVSRESYSSANPLGLPEEPLRKELDSLVGRAVDPLDSALSACDPSDINVVIWRSEARRGSFGGDYSSDGDYSIGVLIPEPWTQNAALYYWQDELRRNELSLDPGVEFIAEELMERSKERSFRLDLASHWNRDNIGKFWRLRACVTKGNGILLRSPICISRDTAVQDNLRLSSEP